MSGNIKSIGITGATGFIGQYLVRHLAPRYRLVAATTPGKDTTAYWQHKNLKYSAVHMEPSALSSLWHSCEAVVHLAAKRPEKIQDPIFADFTANVELTQTVAVACANASITTLINISSCSVYPSIVPVPSNEDGAAKPNSTYGVSKLASEAMANLYGGSGMNVISLRLAQVIGIGERNGYLLGIYLDNCLAQKPLLVYGTGSETRCYIYVKDVCRAIACAIETPTATGAYNIGGGITISNLELAKLYCEVFDNPAGVKICPEIPEGTFNQTMDLQKAERELEYSPAYDLRGALEDMRDIISMGGDH